MTRVPLILNPAAGGGRARAQAPDALARLRGGGLDVSVFETHGPGDATQLARKLRAEGHATLLCAGGDGTTYEVLNGVMDGGPRPRLGMIPLGTGNSFLRDYGVTTTDQAIDAVHRGEARPVDVVRADLGEGHLHYLNLLSVGFTSEVGALTNRRFKALGASGYTVATVIEVARLRHRVFPLRLDGGDWDRRPCVFLSFSNSRYTGGTMCMAPHADAADGRLDVIRVGPLGRLDLLTTFPSIYQGRHLEHPLNEGATAATVELDVPEPLDLMVDGEVVRHVLRRLTVLPGAVEVLA